MLQRPGLEQRDALEAAVPSRAPVQPNPAFLSVPLFLQRVAARLLAAFRAHAGPVLLDPPPTAAPDRRPPREFFARFDAPFGALPRELTYLTYVDDPTRVTPSLGLTG